MDTYLVKSVWMLILMIHLMYIYLAKRMFLENRIYGNLVWIFIAQSNENEYLSHIFWSSNLRTQLLFFLPFYDMCVAMICVCKEKSQNLLYEKSQSDWLKYIHIRGGARFLNGGGVQIFDIFIIWGVRLCRPTTSFTHTSHGILIQIIMV